MAQGNHCAPFGINVEGLKRRGFDKAEKRVGRDGFSGSAWPLAAPAESQSRAG
ncbi:UDP-N-acetylglucosamine acyltransferase [Vibrio cholerae]|nr:UDP-N-acetylglucosamine acyltransferase [Vibrio cholerae]